MDVIYSKIFCIYANKLTIFVWGTVITNTFLFVIFDHLMKLNYRLVYHV